MTMLTPNQVFKNYKELCTYLNEPIVSGNSKIRQLERWKEYFTFRIDKHKYTILSVMYEDITSIPEVSGHIDAIWTRHISIQLYYALAEAAKNPESHNNRYGLNKLILTNQEAFEAVGMVNEDFQYLAWKNPLEDTPTSSVIFYKAASARLYKIITKVLNDMHVKKVINVIDTYLLHTIKGSKSLRLATVDEWGKIRGVSGKLLATEFKLKSGKPATLYDINMKGQNRSFYTRLKEILEEDEIYYSNKVYSISFLSDNLELYNNNYLQFEGEIGMSKEIINNASYEIIKKVIEKQINILPKTEDKRTFDDLANMIPLDKSVYFELLEQTIPLKPEQ
jgi:hypothetical protein